MTSGPRPPDRRRQLILVESVGDDSLGSMRLDLPAFLGRADQCYHLMSGLHQMRHQALANRRRAACDEYPHRDFSS
jgi:hypothetical protein